MLQTTNKKTNEVYNIISEGEKFVVQNVLTSEQKTYSASTFKKYFTKPQDVVNATVETQQEDNGVVQQQDTNEQDGEAFLTQILDIAQQLQCEVKVQNGRIFLNRHNCNIAKIQGKKNPHFYVSPKKISEQLLQQLEITDYKGYTLTAHTSIKNIHVCAQMLQETLNTQQTKLLATQKNDATA